MGMFRTAFSLGLVAVLVALVAGPVAHVVKIAGFLLTPSPTVLAEGQGPIYIEDTTHCEDVHHYRPANLLFTACEDSKSTRFGWFPPLLNFARPPTTPGSIHVVDPKTMKSTRLAFENFKGPFVTHGIDVIEDPEQADAVYIFAVNHLPNPAYLKAGSAAAEAQGIPPARSQIELFRHVLQSHTVQHVRSIWHPLIQTPNDIYAASPHSLYVTNDHFYRDGMLRLVEDLVPAAKWSSVIHVQLSELAASNATAGLDASVALGNVWNNNGLGHGRNDQEVIVSSAMGGRLFLARPQPDNHALSIHTTIQFDTVTDNPSYYADPYRTVADDASGYVVAGVSQGFRLPHTSKDPDGKDPCQVWYARPAGPGAWEKKLLFEDDSSRIRSAAAAVLVPIEPAKDGTKRAWLFVTGFVSESMVAVQVAL